MTPPGDQDTPMQDYEDAEIEQMQEADFKKFIRTLRSSQKQILELQKSLMDKIENLSRENEILRRNQNEMKKLVEQETAILAKNINEMKNSIDQMANTLESLKNRMDEAEERISELEDREQERKQSNQRKEEETSCTTFLLSVFQAITVSPSHSKWARLKSKLSKWIFPSLLFFWVINMLIYIHVIESVRAKLNFTVVGQGYVNAYCQTRKLGDHESRSFISIIVIHDVVFLALMIWSSLYMVWILYRHRRRAQHIHTSSLSSKTSAENKATHIILWMVFCFVFFYLSNNCLTLYGFYASEKNTRLEGIGGILASCYPTFCPFFLMKNNKIIVKLTSFLSNMRMTCCP